MGGNLEAIQTLRTRNQAEDAARAAASILPAPLVLPEPEEDMQVRWCPRTGREASAGARGQADYGAAAP